VAITLREPATEYEQLSEPDAPGAGGQETSTEAEPIPAVGWHELCPRAFELFYAWP